jgi:hypothetical protein
VILREVFVEDVMETYFLSQPHEKNGTMYVGMTRLEVEAVKPCDKN